MTDDIEKNTLLVKAKISSLQKKTSDIVRRGLSDLALLDVKDAFKDEESHFNEWRTAHSKGIIFSRANQYDVAIEWFNKAIRADASYEGSYKERGKAYFFKGEYDKAIEDFDKAIELDPNFVIAYRYRSMTYNAKEQYDKVIEDYSKLIELNPNDDAALLHRVFAYSNKEDINMAISDFKKACDLGNEDGCKHLQKALKKKEEKTRHANVNFLTSQ